MKFELSKSSGMVALLLIILMPPSAIAQQQSNAQRNCINRLNKAGAKVSDQQGKQGLRCAKSAGKGELALSVAECLGSDPRGTIAKKMARTVADDGRHCGEVPDFGYGTGADVNAAASNGRIALFADLFGDALDTALVDCETGRESCRCQHGVLKTAEKLASTKLKEFVKCKRAALGAGASSAAALQACADDDQQAGSLAADTRGKIAKGRAKILGEVSRRCDGPGVSVGSFPGRCSGLTGATLADCIDAAVECRVCQMLNDFDALSIDCDLFDDGNDDDSCENLTPTPTAPLVAFPGAVGFGRFTRGGRGGYVVHVTNLDDEGPGSLRWAVEEAEDPDQPGVIGPRTVVFDVSGIMLLTDQISVDEPFLTIAGQTSPAGITVAGSRLKVKADEVLVRGMRFRAGDDPGGDPKEPSRDGFGIGTGIEINNFIFDHCSATWALDENGSHWGSSSNTTIQSSLFAEAIETNGESFGYLLGTDAGSPPRNVTFYRNAFFSNKDRNPKIKDSATDIEVINNFGYNWVADGMGVSDEGSSDVNSINNYYRHGPDTIDREAFYLRLADHDVYLSGNIHHCGLRSSGCADSCL